MTLEHSCLPFSSRGCGVALLKVAEFIDSKQWHRHWRWVLNTLNFLTVCSSEVKGGPPLSTKQSKVKSTQNYGVHPARTEKCSLSFQQGWKETARGIISVVGELTTASVLGSAPLWFVEPSVWASPWLTNRHDSCKSHRASSQRFRARIKRGEIW